MKGNTLHIVLKVKFWLASQANKRWQSNDNSLESKIRGKKKQIGMFIMHLYRNYTVFIMRIIIVVVTSTKTCLMKLYIAII